MIDPTFSYCYGHLWIAYFEPVSSSKKDISNPEQTEGPATHEDAEEDTEVPKKQKSIPKKRRRICLCPVQREGTKCAFERLNNNSALGSHACSLLVYVPVAHVFPKAPAGYSPFSLVSVQQRSNLPDVQSQIITLILNFLASTSISFSALGSPYFNNLVSSLLLIGQRNPQSIASFMVPTITRHNIVAHLEQKASEIFRSLLSGFQGHYVSIAFDCGQINHYKYAGICLSLLDHECPIRFLQLAYAPSTKDDYIIFIRQILAQLETWKIRVSTICTDGLPAQVEAIKAIQEFIQKHGVLDGIAVPLIPYHVPCFNHRINLIVKRCTESNPSINNLVNELKLFSVAANKKDYHKILNKVCPVFISTRWFCLSLMAGFVRMKRKEITENGMLSQVTVLELLRLEIILNPLTELHLFLEKETTRLSFVYPALLRAVLQYYWLSQQTEFAHEQWLHAISDILIQLINYTLSNGIDKLLLLAFSLSPFGRYLFANGMLASAFDPKRPLDTIDEFLRSTDSSATSDWLDYFVHIPSVLDGKDTTDVQTERHTTHEETMMHKHSSSSIEVPSVSSSSCSSSSSSCSSSSSSSSCSSTSDFESPIGVTDRLFKRMEERIDTIRRTDSNLGQSFLLGIPPPTLTGTSTNASKQTPVNAVDAALLTLANNQETSFFHHENTCNKLVLTSSEGKRETLLMPIQDLVSILNHVQNEKTYCQVDSSYVNFDDYGLLAAEEYEKYDEYVERTQSEPVQRRQQPLRKKTAGSSMEKAIEISDDSTNEEEIDSTGEHVDVPVLNHGDFRDDPTETEVIRSTILKIVHSADGNLSSIFRSHLQSILAPQCSGWIEPLCQTFRSDMSVFPMLQQVERLKTRMLFSIEQDGMKGIYSIIVHSLVYSLASESPCERLFSKVGTLCRGRITNILIQTLNYRLLLADAQRFDP